MLLPRITGNLKSSSTLKNHAADETMETERSVSLITYKKTSLNYTQIKPKKYSLQTPSGTSQYSHRFSGSEVQHLEVQVQVEHGYSRWYSSLEELRKLYCVTVYCHQLRFSKHSFTDISQNIFNTINRWMIPMGCGRNCGLQRNCT